MEKRDIYSRLTGGAVKMRIKRAKARLLFLYRKLYGSY